MDKKLKMRKNVILYMFTMLAVLMGCFFLYPGESESCRTAGSADQRTGTDGGI